MDELLVHGLSSRHVNEDHDDCVDDTEAEDGETNDASPLCRRGDWERVLVNTLIVVIGHLNLGVISVCPFFVAFRTDV